MSSYKEYFAKLKTAKIKGLAAPHKAVSRSGVCAGPMVPKWRSCTVRLASAISESRRQKT